jgi:hypothetical protein
MRGKRAQVTIFIIVAILLVIGIILMFIFLGNTKLDSPTAVGPQSFVESCAKEIVEDSLQKIIYNGGQINPTQTLQFNGENYTYLCYQSEYYLSCYNLHPMLEQQIEKEIFSDTSIAIQNCFDTVREDFESQGYEVGVESDGGDTIYNVDILPGQVNINLTKKFFISKNNLPQHFEKFDTKIPSTSYELIEITRRIVNEESIQCKFDHIEYMLMNPNYEIKKTNYYPSTIYEITNQNTQDKLRFAIQTCVSPPGI